MGQKVNPYGFRLGVTTEWKSRWFADRDYARFVEEDLRIRRHVKAKLHSAGISKIVIERAANKAKVFVHAAKPGIILGKRATGLDGPHGCGKEFPKYGDIVAVCDVDERRCRKAYREYPDIPKYKDFRDS